MEYVVVKSYDDKLVRVPVDKKNEYLKTQNLIRKYLKQGKSLKEIKELLKSE